MIPFIYQVPFAHHSTSQKRKHTPPLPASVRRSASLVTSPAVRSRAPSKQSILSVGIQPLPPLHVPLDPRSTLVLRPSVSNLLTPPSGASPSPAPSPTMPQTDGQRQNNNGPPPPPPPPVDDDSAPSVPRLTSSPPPAGADLSPDVEERGRSKLLHPLSLPKNRSTGNLSPSSPDPTDRSRFRMSFDATSVPPGELDNLGRCATPICPHPPI